MRRGDAEENLAPYARTPFGLVLATVPASGLRGTAGSQNRSGRGAGRDCREGRRPHRGTRTDRDKADRVQPRRGRSNCAEVTPRMPHHSGGVSRGSRLGALDRRRARADAASRSAIAVVAQAGPAHQWIRRARRIRSEPFCGRWRPTAPSAVKPLPNHRGSEARIRTCDAATKRRVSPVSLRSGNTGNSAVPQYNSTEILFTPTVAQRRLADLPFDHETTRDGSPARHSPPRRLPVGSFNQRFRMSWEALAWAKDSDIAHPVAKFILVLLANKADENFSCYPSIRTLMAESGAGRSTVLRALSYLEMRGLMTRRPQFHDSGARRSTRYYLNHPRAQHLLPGPDPGPPSPNAGPPVPCRHGARPISRRGRCQNGTPRGSHIGTP